jgi:methionine sulfoxide reductase heme-binding subunit
MKLLKLSPLQWLAHLGSLAPLAVMVYLYFTGGLTVNPIQDIIFRTGLAALVLLVLSLACTPLNTLFGWHALLKLRRPLGLYAFLYMALHLLAFAGLDYAFDWELIKENLFEKRYALVGFASFLILIPLALTSTQGWQRRLGKQWKTLHQGVYLAAPLAVLHWVWLVKSDVRLPLAYGAVVAVLLLVRVPWVKRLLRNAGRALVPQRAGGPGPRRPARRLPADGHD